MTHTRAVRADPGSASPARRAGLHPLLVALGLLALAAIGALFTVYVIAPATETTPAPAASEPLTPRELERPTP